MKVLKTEPDQYGWYFVFHKLKDGTIKIFHKTTNKKYKEYEQSIHVYQEGLYKLKEIMGKVEGVG